MSLTHARDPIKLSDSNYGEQTEIIEKFLVDDLGILESLITEVEEYAV